MVELLKKRPEKVCDFIVNWVKKEGKDIEKIRLQKPQNYDGSHLPQSEDSFVDPEEEADEFEYEKIQQKQRQTKKKFAISAEAYGEYNKLENFKARVIEKSDEQKQQIAQILSKNFMFSSLEKKDQDIVINAMEVKNYQNGDNVIKEGDEGSELFIVYSGKLKCTKKFPDQEEPKYLKDYVSGEVFGELALMYNAPRAASIDAIEESVCFSLDRDTFNHIVKNAAIDRRNKYDGFLKQIDILSQLSPYEREKICDCLTTEYFKKDDTIINQGEEGEKFYLIQEGTAQALKNQNGKQEVVYEYK